MNRVICRVIGTAALVLSGMHLNMQTTEASPRFADGGVPPLYPVTQRFAPSIETPLTLDSAKRGAAVVELASTWDFDSFGLEVVFAPLQCRIFITGTSVTTAYCPEEFATPLVKMNDENLTLTLPNIDVLKFPFFKIAARLVSRTNRAVGPWVTFPSALANSIQVPGKLELRNALAQPPTNGTLEIWIDALLNETLRSAVFGASRAQLGISYVYSLTPSVREPVFVSVPILVTDWAVDRATLASELAHNVQDWIRTHAPSSNNASIHFNIAVHYQGLGQSNLQFQADQVTLDLHWIHPGN